MGGKYQIRYYDKESSAGYTTVYTDSWFKFMKVRIFEDVIFYKIIEEV